MTVLGLAQLVAKEDGPDEKALAESEALLPSEKLKASFEKEVPIRFSTSTQNKKQWDELKTFWNESTEKGIHPRTGKEVIRKVVVLKVPLGLQTPPPIPPENPMTVAKFQLGKRLYFDNVISSNNTVACATCHNPVRGFTDQSRFPPAFLRNKEGLALPRFTTAGIACFSFGMAGRQRLRHRPKGPRKTPRKCLMAKGTLGFI